MCAYNSLFGVVSYPSRENSLVHPACAMSIHTFCEILFFAHMFTCRFGGNNIGGAGAKALADGLQHCTKLQGLRYLP